MRSITTGMRTASQAAVVRPVTLVALYLDSGTVRCNSSDRTVTWSGDTYLGVGRLGSITAIQETTTLQTQSVRLTMSGIPADYISMVWQEIYQDRAVKIWLALLDENYVIVADPILQWDGLIDQMSMQIGESAIVSVTTNDKMIRWETPQVHRYTDADQQRRFPGDLGCQFIAQAVEKEILWGRPG